MREIKFRGLTAKGEWAYGLPASDAPNSTAYYQDYSQRLCWLLESGGYANVPIKNGTLCQFTGLKDRDETEIYEGDIVVWDDPVLFMKFKIEWDEDGAFYHATATGGGGCTLHGLIAQCPIKIIGNIYENPDLLS